MKKRQRRPRMTIEQAIEAVMGALVWRVKCLLEEKRPETDNQARAVRFYSARFGAVAAEKLARLLRRRADRLAPPRTLKITIRPVAPAQIDVALSNTPEDLIRRQRERE